MQIGRDEGGRILCGGDRPKGGYYDHGSYYLPTVIEGLPNSARMCREEIFGPVLAIMPYDSEAQAIEIANDTEFGLAAYVQSTDMAHARRVARQLRAGQVNINYPDWDIYAPFGGYKQSGNGREGGVYGMEEYLEYKSLQLRPPKAPAGTTA